MPPTAMPPDRPGSAGAEHFDPRLDHPILQESFRRIDRAFPTATADPDGPPLVLSPAEYAIARRVIHSTADFELARCLRFSPGVMERAIAALAQGCPIVADTTMVAQGIRTLAGKTFGNRVIAAIDVAPDADPGRTRTETGILRCWATEPGAVYAIGNAPTALLALVAQLQAWPPETPLPLVAVIGAPVGFVAVEESKAALAALPQVPQIRIDGPKGGSPATAAIVNALLRLAWDQASMGLEG